MFVYIYLKKPKRTFWKYRHKQYNWFKKFWKTVKPIFGSKVKSRNNITLAESTIVIQEEELAKTFNEFFVSIVKNLGINENRLSSFNSETDNVESIVSKFDYYPSIVTIRNCLDKNCAFSFQEIVKTEVINEKKSWHEEKITL